MSPKPRTDAEALSAVMQSRRADVAAAMAGLCKAVKVVAECRDDLEKRLRHVYPTHADDKALIGMARAATHLTQAVADVPEEMWAVMLSDCIETPEQTIAELRKAFGIAA